MAGTYMRKRSLYKIGLKGEDALRGHLREILTDEHTVLYNVPVEKGDIDCIIIGPDGLYAIEAKNHKGVITYADSSWKQVKRSRNGSFHTGSLKNPSFQLIGNIKWLKGYLARYNICLLYTSDAADDLLCVDLGGRRILKKKKQHKTHNKATYTR